MDFLLLLLLSGATRACFSHFKRKFWAVVTTVFSLVSIIIFVNVFVWDKIDAEKGGGGRRGQRCKGVRKGKGQKYKDGKKGLKKEKGLKRAKM